MSAALSSGALRELTIGRDPPLTAILGVPDNARGIVIFAHGSGRDG